MVDTPQEKIPFVHHLTLDYTKPDSVGYRPDVDMIGKKYFHAKTQRIYTVDGFIWDSDIDQWKVSYNREECITSFARLPINFVAPRFIEIK